MSHTFFLSLSACFKESGKAFDGKWWGYSAEFCSLFVLNPNHYIWLAAVMQLRRLTKWKSILDDGYSAMEILKEVLR